MKALYKYYLFLYGFLMPMYILFIKGTSFIYLLSVGLIVIVVVYNCGKIKYSLKKQDGVYIVFFLVTLFSTIIGILFSRPDQWKWQAFVFFAYSVVLFAIYYFLQRESGFAIARIVSGLRIGLLVNVIYGYVQVLLDKLFRLDINDLIFVKALKMVNTSSHYHFGKLVPSGFTWHPGAYAPILVTAYCMFYDNFLVKAMIIGMAFLTKSSTCSVGVVICVLLEGFFRIRKADLKVQIRTMITLSVVLIAASVVAVKSGLISLAVSEIERVFSRVQTANVYVADNFSTYYHVRYYLGIGKIASHANILQILFGIGGGCSGYAFMRVFDQYVGMPPWDVESQVIADLISYGVIGFVLLSVWMIRAVKRGSKIDNRYTIFFLSVFTMFLTYNIRFSWVLVFLFLIQISIKKRVSIWGLSDKEKKRALDWYTI